MKLKLAIASFTLLAIAFGKTSVFSAEQVSAGSAISAWDPKHTLVLMVGVLKWKSGELESFSSKFRRDAQLLQELIKAGVPKEQTSYLADSKATLAAILANLRKSLDNCPAGDTYVFYYCGHGWLDDDDKSKGYFGNYDAGDSNKSCLSMDAIVKEFDKRFKGSQVIFLADCCRAGQLVKALKKSKFKYAVLTSATSAQDSTGNWTFTQAVLDTVYGHAYADANRDGVISFDELGTYCKEEMKVIEGQEATVAFGNGFDRNMKVANVKFRTESIPERVEVKFEGDWWQAKLLERRGTKARVHWLDIGWDAPADDSWVKLKNVRKMVRK